MRVRRPRRALAGRGRSRGELPYRVTVAVGVAVGGGAEGGEEGEQVAHVDDAAVVQIGARVGLQLAAGVCATRSSGGCSGKRGAQFPCVGARGLKRGALRMEILRGGAPLGAAVAAARRAVRRAQRIVGRRKLLSPS